MSGPALTSSTSTSFPSRRTLITRKGGRFGDAHRAPATRPDPALWPSADFDLLVQAFEAHGFRPPCAWYLNDDANMVYARKAPNGGHLLLPILFINGDFDQINSINGNEMSARCVQPAQT